MLKEAIETIADLTKDGLRISELAISGVPHKTLLVKKDGDGQWIDHPPTPRAHHVDDIDSLLMFAESESSIWINSAQVHAAHSRVVGRRRMPSVSGVNVTRLKQQRDRLDALRNYGKSPCWLERTLWALAIALAGGAVWQLTSM